VAKKDTYSVHTKKGDVYSVLKYDTLGEATGVYTVMATPSGYTCDCPAGQRGICRHREMVILFKSEGMIDNPNVQYNYDKPEWIVRK
jgi:hypothetical protein